MIQRLAKLRSCVVIPAAAAATLFIGQQQSFALSTGVNKVFCAETSMGQSSAAMGPGIQVVPSSKLFITEPNPSWFGNSPNPRNDSTWTNKNWLKSRFHFSFAEYSNGRNLGFGPITVLNDDLVQPHRGFGAHPHRDMEIITYIVEGSLTHKDSMGTEESLGRGSVQFMTAGTGVMHAEHNLEDRPLRFIQTWIKPSSRGLPVNYGSSTGRYEDRRNRLQHIMSGVGDGSSPSAPVEIHQSVDAYVSELDLGVSVNLALKKRMAYMVCLEGAVTLNGGQVLQRHDAVEIMGDDIVGGSLNIEATGVEDVEGGRKTAHFLVFAMPLVSGTGRKDL